MMSDKILVMGPGRSGTTFIWCMLRELGFSTEPAGYEDRPMFEIMRYGDVMNRLDRGEVEWPKVIKHLGGFCYHLNDHIDRYGWGVEHIFYCLRREDKLVNRFFEAEKVNHKLLELPADQVQNMTEDQKRERLTNKIREEVGAGLFNLIDRDHPYTIIRFPRSILDVDYCYRKMEPVLKPREIWCPEFKEKWESARTSWGKNLQDRHYDEERREG